MVFAARQDGMRPVAVRRAARRSRSTDLAGRGRARAAPTGGRRHGRPTGRRPGASGHVRQPARACATWAPRCRLDSSTGASALPEPLSGRSPHGGPLPRPSSRSCRSRRRRGCCSRRPSPRATSRRSPRPRARLDLTSDAAEPAEARRCGDAARSRRVPASARAVRGLRRGDRASTGERCTALSPQVITPTSTTIAMPATWPAPPPARTRWSRRSWSGPPSGRSTGAGSRPGPSCSHRAAILTPDPGRAAGAHPRAAEAAFQAGAYRRSRGAARRTSTRRISTRRQQARRQLRRSPRRRPVRRRRSVRPDLDAVPPRRRRSPATTIPDLAQRALAMACIGAMLADRHLEGTTLEEIAELGAVDACGLRTVPTAMLVAAFAALVRRRLRGGDAGARSAAGRCDCSTPRPPTTSSCSATCSASPCAPVRLDHATAWAAGGAGASASRARRGRSASSTPSSTRCR